MFAYTYAHRKPKIMMWDNFKELPIDLMIDNSRLLWEFYVLRALPDAQST